jgi:hypothetical protein
MLIREYLIPCPVRINGIGIGVLWQIAGKVAEFKILNVVKRSAAIGLGTVKIDLDDTARR